MVYARDVTVFWWLASCRSGLAAMISQTWTTGPEAARIVVEPGMGRRASIAEGWVRVMTAGEWESEPCTSVTAEDDVGTLGSQRRTVPS